VASGAGFFANEINSEYKKKKAANADEYRSDEM